MTKKLGEICQIIRGSGLSKNDLTDHGIGAIHYGEIYTKYNTISVDNTISYVDSKKAKKLKTVNNGDIILTVTSENLEDVLTPIVWLGDKDIVTGGHTVILKNSPNPKYLAYYFKSDKIIKQKYKLAHGVKVIEVSLKDLAKIEISLPSLDKQKEIVAILDQFECLIKHLEMELSLRQKQFEYYLRLIFSSVDGEIKPLQQIAIIGTGSSDTKDGLENGKYPFFTRSENHLFKDTYEFDETAIITSGDGNVGKVFHYYEGKYALHQRAYRIVPNKDIVCSRYLYYYFQENFYPYINRYKYSGTVNSIRKPMMNKFPVKIPSISVQTEIVNALDTFTTYISLLEQEIGLRKKQFECYRNALLK